MSEGTASGAQAQGATSDKKTGDQQTQQQQGQQTQQQATGDKDKGGQQQQQGAQDKSNQAAGGGTVLDDKGQQGDDKDKQVKADWPDNWRERASTGKDGKVDDARLKRLQRYTSPAAALEALIHAQDRIAKGDLQKVLGANPSAEELAEYRAANGIPEKPADYKLELANGRVVGEADKPLVDKFLEALHKSHAPPALVNATVNAYYDLQDEVIRQREDDDLDAKVALEDALRPELGTEYRSNVAAVQGMLKQFPDGVGDKLLSARFADGSLIFNDPSVVRHFMQLARDLNPAATVVPGSAGNAQQTIEDEITGIRALIKDGESEYYKAPKVEKVINGQKHKDTPKALRFLELLAAKERLGKAA